jgi:hypothetical protein
MDRLSARIVDPNNSKSISSRARAKRWAKFSEVFPDIRDMRVIDLGGTTTFWQNVPQKPAHVTVVNLGRVPSAEGIDSIQGDACNPRPELLGQQFDLAVSNSLIEHVGGHVQRERLADAIHSLADRHWVQTPYRYFPIEPHWMAPGIQFLPFEAKVRATLRWKLGHLKTDDRQAAIDSVNEVELIGLTQMRHYFPTSQIWQERMMGLTKSMVAIR